MSSTSLPPEVPLDADAGRLIARAERLRCFVAAAQDQMNAAFLRAAAAIIHRHHCDANVFLVNYESPRRVLGWSPASAADVLAHGFDPDEPEACKALRAMQMPFADLASVDNLVDETRGCLTSVAAAEWVELHYAQDLYAVDIDRALQDPAPPADGGAAGVRRGVRCEVSARGDPRAGCPRAGPEDRPHPGLACVLRRT